MTAFFLSLWLAISGFFGFTPESASTTEQAQQTPAGTPGQSAPPSAIAACSNKTHEEHCSFTMQNNDFTGVCKTSGDTLACTPVLPE